MKEKKIYNKNKVLVVHVGQDDVDGMLINWDLNDKNQYGFMEKEFIKLLIDYLPEYAMGFTSSPISQMNVIPYLRESAKSVLNIKYIKEIKEYLDNNVPYTKWSENVLKYYNAKGLFSELILHCILREFKDTVPLISKIYFKDSNAVEAHGFDAVHIVDNDQLWLGETKFYQAGKAGLNALINDLKEHFIQDYLKSEFVIIKRALINNDGRREEWLQKLEAANRLEDKFKLIRIPLLCIYEDKIVETILKEINMQRDIFTIYCNHVQAMKDYFDQNNQYVFKDKVQVILILLPVQSKNRIVSSLLQSIYHLQNI